MPEPLTSEDDVRLPEFGYGITNLIARPTPGIDTLEPREFIEGWNVLERKVRRLKPAVLALVGVTVWRAIFPLLDVDEDDRRRLRAATCPGPLPLTLHGAQLFVLPNPSGRNANFSYTEMLRAFRRLRTRHARTACAPPRA